MDHSNIQEIWKQHEIQLDSTRKLNVTLLKEIKLDKAKSTLNNLLFLPISTLLFYIFAASYSLYFMVTYWGTWYFAFSGAVIVLTSLLYIFASIRQLKQLLSIDYNAPILKLQKDISQIKSSIVNNLRIAAWILPFGPFIGVFFAKALFDFDLTVFVSIDMIASFGLITLLLEIIALLISRALRPKNVNKRWVNWLLKGSGSQVDEALGFLDQIKEFEMEEKGKKDTSG